MQEQPRIKALLVDDEPHCLELLAYELKQHCPEVHILHMCPTGKCGLKAIQDFDPELLFLDIDMPYLNGFEMLELVPNPRFQVIFTTAYDEFALQAFRMSAVDYLLKPVDGYDLRRAVNRFRERKKQLEFQKQIPFLLSQIKQSANGKLERVAFPTSEGLVFVNLDEILYCKSESNYCHVVLKEEENLLIAKTLKEVEGMLRGPSFIRVHHSYLVNLSEVNRYQKSDGGLLVMSNGDEVKVSRSRKEELLNRFE